MVSEHPLHQLLGCCVQAHCLENAGYKMMTNLKHIGKKWVFFYKTVNTYFSYLALLTWFGGLLIQNNI
jgi:hypothetical protein